MNSIQKIIGFFSKFPTIGPRTAARFAYYLVKLEKKEFNEFIHSLERLRDDVKLCSFCFCPFESEESLCPICSDKTRSRESLCVVEKEQDLLSIEKTKKYRGLYFILGGNINLKKENGARINELKERIEKMKFKEIILAINPTPEGETTTLFLEREIEKYKIKTSRLGRGLPVGGEMEYADEETLSSAFEGRK
ncbi:MAG: recombination protein RecR [Candidatus Nealsonbacteria bacterium RIFOXYB1_FULL_40_15]|uniref:Recombination protein RecR n=2 Tax=Candidatus Nealsoniibacteriota TaxID=1817911 RepID=A0A1G2ERH7_9BACT|nr:MAG: recombination protein RecR [Candidatus Nealsonbacteria bacterium RIFOXYB1_FULL_40_15]OGZ28337.1 MAG: recombination protein RecR [Candidatus Nealsonbacteria bacterium RIFOXYC1_FULL_40_7]OGZ29528.1 MAG: recombination protein RecR [Candidatus Nealsonbacteria bacterium RIFOXYD1_FULL_39_11]